MQSDQTEDLDSSSNAARGWWTGRPRIRGARRLARKLLAVLGACRRRLLSRSHGAGAPPHAGVPVAVGIEGPVAGHDGVETSPSARDLPPRRPNRAGGPRVPSLGSFRVLFVIRPGVWDAAAMRYRGYNLVEALRGVGVEVVHLDDRQIPGRLAEALSSDLIVLVRRQLTPEIEMLLEGAGRLAIPVVCDLDDYLFDEEVIPHVAMFRDVPIDEARAMVRDWRAVPARCQFFTGSTPFLVEKAAAMGKGSYLIRNGLNEAQLELSRRALERSREAGPRDGLRLGYFSGTRTHQDDFRLIAGVLARVMEEFPDIRLVVAGDFDLGEFPDFGRFAGRVEERPFVDWRLLPDEIARVDVNLIPLEVNPFTEGKSNLKYYEAALVKVPSVATATRVYVECITHGLNGFLAGDADDWYASLRALIVDPALREQVGERAHRHVVRAYVPGTIALQASTAYREMLLEHRRALGVADDSPTVAVLLDDLERSLRDRSGVLALAVALAQSGAILTVHLPEGPDGIAAPRALDLIAEHGFDPCFAVEVGGEVPCCDLLLATDAETAHRAKRFEHRAPRCAYLVAEYEPAHLPYGEARERALRSYRLGLELVAIDLAVADLLARHHDAGALVLPGWVETPARPARECHEPATLLVATVGSLPDHAWSEGVEALGRVRAGHPDIEVVLCGDAADRGNSAGLPYRTLPRLAGDEFAALLAEQPVCLALYPTGRPAWLHDLLAAGCPVVASAACADHRGGGAEQVEGFVAAAADAGSLARAIESLLVDRIRMSALTFRAAEIARDLADPRQAARTLLRAFETEAARDRGRPPLRRDGDDRGGPMAQVA